MYYINSKPSATGDYGNPQSYKFKGSIALPEELLGAYTGAKAFARLTVEGNTVIAVERNEEAYNAYETSRTETSADELRQKLAETDYIACKIAEGAATREEYADMIAQRQAWRDEINRLEATQ